MARNGYGWVLVAAVCTATLIAATAGSGDGGDAERPVEKSAEKSVGKSAEKSGDKSGERSVEGLPAAEISDKARHELLNAASLHVTVVDRSKGAGATAPSAMDLALDQDKNCTATLTFGADGEADVVRRGDRLWLRMDDALWRARVPGAKGRAAAERFKGHWVTGPVTDPVLKDYARVCDLDALREQLRGGAESGKAVTKGAPTTLDGTPVIPLTGTEKDGTRKTLYVAARGTPYALKYTEVGAGAPGARRTDTTTLYAGYGQPVPARTPAAADAW